MRITKFVHSCLLAETDESSVLFDPGVFSWESGTFDINGLNKLDFIVITHEHPDHFHLPFINELIEKFPDAKIITTESVKKKLDEQGIKNASTESEGPIRVFSKKPHAPLGPVGPAPENIAVHFDDYLTVGGDRHDMEESKDILALTVTAPWGAMTRAIEMALELQPKKVLPVHDWHWGDAGRKWSYNLLNNVLDGNGIEFVFPVDGRANEV